MSGTFGRQPSDAAYDTRLSGRDRRVLHDICNHLGKSWTCRRKQSEIAKAIGSDRKGVNRSLKKLEELGYVAIVESKGRSLTYRVIVADNSGGQTDLFAREPQVRQTKPTAKGRKTAATWGQMAPSDVPVEAPSDGAARPTPIEQTFFNRGPVGPAAPRDEREVDPKSSEPVPTRTEPAGAALPSDATGAVPGVNADDEADAVPFLAPAQPDRLDRMTIDAMEDRLRTAAGASIDATSPSLFDLSAVFRWLSAGCDLDRDIVPAIAGRAARHRGRAIRTWGYFEEPVLEARQRRLALEARMAEPPTNIIPFDPRGARNGEPDRAAPRRSRPDDIRAAFARRLGQPDAE